jgi:hypothetical protein
MFYFALKLNFFGWCKIYFVHSNYYEKYFYKKIKKIQRRIKEKGNEKYMFDNDLIMLRQSL